MSFRVSPRALRGGVIFSLLAVSLAAGAAPAQAKVTTVDGSFDRPGAVAAGGGWMAVTQAQYTRAWLFVGKLGEQPVRVPGPTYLPYWAYPHFGTDAAGKSVLVYPACEQGDCDLHMLDPATGSIAPVPGASSPHVNEVEGDLDRGAVALIAAAPKRPRSREMRLVYRPADGKARTLNHLGGEHVNLDRGRILTYRIGGHAADATCAPGLIELTRVSGARTQLARIGCGEDQPSITGLGFVGKQRVAWGASARSGSAYVQRDLAAGSTARSVRSLRQFISYAPVDAHRALLVGGPIDYAGGPDPDGEPAFPLYDVTGVDVDASDASGQRG